MENIWIVLWQRRLNILRMKLAGVNEETLCDCPYQFKPRWRTQKRSFDTYRTEERRQLLIMKVKKPISVRNDRLQAIS